VDSLEGGAVAEAASGEGEGVVLPPPACVSLPPPLGEGGCDAVPGGAVLPLAAAECSGEGEGGGEEVQLPAVPVSEGGGEREGEEKVVVEGDGRCACVGDGQGENEGDAAGERVVEGVARAWLRRQGSGRRRPPWRWARH
jgi:hypothetical protein